MVRLIDKREFTLLAIDKNSKTFVMNMAALQVLLVELFFKTAKITRLK